MRSLALLVFLALPLRLDAQATITGRVATEDGRPIPDASVVARLGAGTTGREAVTDSAGEFRIGGLAAGVYTVSVRKVGFRSAGQAALRLAEGQTRRLEVTLTTAPLQLSAVRVVSSPTAVDLTTPELTTELDRQFTELLPGARTASSLIQLVPGARKDQLWGGAPGVSNNYQLDGVAMNHPGIGGDFLQMSVDWIESLDVQGLGAGAEHGNFQGGLINARTRTGTNVPAYAMRANYESPDLSASNFNLAEDGVEQAGRREVAGEILGPIARDRLFYFLGGQFVSRDLRSPNLATPGVDFQDYLEQQEDLRAVGKLTWLPALGHRVDLLAGLSNQMVERAGINAIDQASATKLVNRPTSYFALSWERASPTDDSRLEARVGGFRSVEARDAYRGRDVPGILLMQPGRTPAMQNAAFSERREPSSLTATLQWEKTAFAIVPHALTIGGELARGRWRDERVRNGGLTWRPFTDGLAGFDPANTATWGPVGSEWGGNMRINSDIASRALFVQDEMTLGANVVLSAGLRAGWWAGFIRPFCAATEPCYRFEAVRAHGLDPRLGVVWDVTGRGHLAVKAHVGRYHQGMHALFFDRVAGADVYENQRFYDRAPALSRPDTVITPAQRDAPSSGFPATFQETIYDVTGRVDGYRQPYVDQAVLAVEKSWGPRWKGEAIYTARRNGNIVGLVDRNRMANWTPIFDVHVDNRYVRGIVVGPGGERLVLPRIYVSNQDIIAALDALPPGASLDIGYPMSYLQTLTYDPDIVLTTASEARRVYDQVTVLLRTVQRGWRAEASFTGARLRGNVPGIAGLGTTGTRYTAGPFVNPNEGINGYGTLPDALEAEIKAWGVARLPLGLEGGLVFTHIFGERFAPTFEIGPNYSYHRGTGSPYPNVLFRRARGQQLLLEPRGDRHLASRDIVDAHLSWRAPRGLVITADLFNVFGENELTAVQTVITDQAASDPSAAFGAARQRVQPRTLRIGMRVE